METRTLTIVSRKYDGAFRFSLSVELLHRSTMTLLGIGRPGRTVRRWDGDRSSPYWSLEYLPLDRPYNIVSWYRADGSVEGHFCNVLAGQELADGTLSYVDLDLDVVVRPDGSYRVEDRDQFDRNAHAMGYPPELRALAHSALDELVALAEAGDHLFRCRSLEEGKVRLLELYAHP